jgi:hypothetical protein
MGNTRGELAMATDERKDAGKGGETDESLKDLSGKKPDRDQEEKVKGGAEPISESRIKAPRNLT